MTIHKRVIVISHRLPEVSAGNGAAAAGDGCGMVAALSPVLAECKGLWIGTAGAGHGATAGAAPYETQTLSASEAEHRGHDDFCHQVLWPLFHELPSRCNFDPRFWEAYEQVNRTYAELAAGSSGPEDRLWVHDHQLISVGRFLPEGASANADFFLHIPFPSPDIFAKIPWRTQLLRDLLRYRMIGFQTHHDRANFVQCARALLRDVNIEKRGQSLVVKQSGRQTIVGSFPMGVDFDADIKLASAPRVSEAAQRIRAALPSCRVILAVDSLDRTQGIAERLHAFQNLLRRYKDVHRQVVMLQIVIPDEIHVDWELEREIDVLANEINGTHAQPGWMPVRLLQKRLSREDLFAYFRAADVALVTPLKDGMNLVAKEFCAAQLDRPAVLVLSEFSGAAAQLRCGSLLVNPYDEEGVADALHRACGMSRQEKEISMRRLRQAVARFDVHRWAAAFLQCAASDGADPGRMNPASHELQEEDGQHSAAV